MLWYALVWYNEWESFRLYDIVYDFTAMEWDSNAMVWFNAMLCDVMVYVVNYMLELTV